MRGSRSWRGIAIFSAIILSSLSAVALGTAEAAQILISTIGDFDCFGYGIPPNEIPSVQSPCGALAGYPIQEGDDAANTDQLLACPGPSTITYTHTYTVPEGMTIAGAVWAINLGGIEKSKFATTLLLGGVFPIPVPATGRLGTTLIIVPIVPPLTSILEGGSLTVQLIRGNTSGSLCDDVFVDSLSLAIAVH